MKKIRTKLLLCSAFILCSCSAPKADITYKYETSTMLSKIMIKDETLFWKISTKDIFGDVENSRSYTYNKISFKNDEIYTYSQLLGYYKVAEIGIIYNNEVLRHK